MKISAIIPVKTFINAKTRLDLSQEKKIQLCSLMLNEVLQVISDSNIFEKVIVVSKDDDVSKLCRRFNADLIFDEKEIGVNNAVSLADEFLKKTSIDCSIVFPQDIPLIQISDIENFLQFHSDKSVIVVPSQRFDGTNAFFRKPFDIMKTHYDEDSYKIHLEVGKTKTNDTFLVLVRRIMMDVDNNNDLNFLLSQNEKPQLRQDILNLISD